VTHLDQLSDELRVEQLSEMLQYANAVGDHIMCGDFNAFQFENSVSLLEAGANGLNNLYDLLTPEERYSYLFEGNSQALDHMLVSNSLVSGAQFDAVHINTGQSDGASDHDGLVALLTVVGAGNNQLVGTSGADTLAGLAGNDTYTVNNAGDVVVEGSNAGTDSVLSSVSYALTNNVENLTLTETAANGTGNGLANTVTGNASANTLDGGDGDDVLIGRGGNDRLLGGNGIDTASFALAAAGVHVQLNSGEVRNDGDGGVDVVSAVENVAGSSFADLIIGDAGSNVINGGLGSDTLLGLDGNDTLIGGTGIANEIYGGRGDDLYVVTLTGDNLIENTGEGTDTVQTDLGSLGLRANFENLTYTGSGDFGGTGNDLDNILTGASGRDRLDGSEGNDTLIGRGGIDSLIGGNGLDTADYSAALAGASVRLSVQLTLDDGDGSFDVLTSVENVTGSAFGDQLFGDAGSNVINGGLGSDILLGLDGNDTLIGGTGVANEIYGGLGDDLYILAAVGDTVIENLGEGTDTVQTSLGNHTLRANFENLSYTGSGDFSGTGNGLANAITGGAGSDTLTGGQGNDTLAGGLGTDTAVLSGIGNDYSIEALGGGSYRITDNVAGRDGIDTLSGIEFLQFGNGVTVVLGGGASAPLSTADKADGDALVQPGLIDDGFIDTKGADLPQVQPGLDHEMPWADAWLAPTGPYILVREGHALTLLDGLSPDDQGHASGSHHGDWHQA
jgi:Ca2+-binding RTX toxin-like protein